MIDEKIYRRAVAFPQAVRDTAASYVGSMEQSALRALFADKDDDTIVRTWFVAKEAVSDAVNRGDGFKPPWEVSDDFARTLVSMVCLTDEIIARYETSRPCYVCGEALGDVDPHFPGVEGLCHPDCCPDC